MLHCTEKTITPCFHYEGEQAQQNLSAFLKANGGQEAEFLKDGTAIFTSVIKTEPKLVYLFPGCWVRAIRPAHFSICSDKNFADRFELVSARPAMSEEMKQANYNCGVLAGLTPEAAKELVDKMDSKRVAGQ